MKILIFALLIVAGCTSQDFYSKLKNEKDVFGDFTGKKGNKKELGYFSKELKDSKKIIEIGTFPFLDASYTLIYDATGEKTYYIKNNPARRKSVEYGSFSLNDKKNRWFKNLEFVLQYVLDDKVQELKTISQNAYNVYNANIVIIIADLEGKSYKEYQIDSFEVYNGEPIMSSDEFWSIDWSKQ